MSLLFADIAIPLAIDKLFTYVVPQEFHESIKRGVRVSVPFGNRKVIGFVINLKNKSELIKLKEIKEIIDDASLIPDDLFNLTSWMSDYYFAPIGEVLKCALLHGALKPGNKILSLEIHDINHWITSNKSPSKQISILKKLQQEPFLTKTQLEKKLNIGSISSQLTSLINQGVVRVDEKPSRQIHKPKFETVVEINSQSSDIWQTWLKEFYARSSVRQKKQIAVIQYLLHRGTETNFISVSDILKYSRATFSTIKTLERNKVLQLSKREVIRTPEYDLYKSALGTLDYKLNSHQESALNKIVEQIETGKFQTFLLYGVTGSGKTQVYIDTIKTTIKLGKTAIVLVPEISLTPQIVRRFKYYFGENVIVMHSRMTSGERYDAWRMAWEGKCSVVIGPRSAIFAPLKNIGLIVVDEEHDISYKQFDQAPRYNARDVAIMRASFCKAAVVLGSATPSVESYTNAVQGKYILLELPERVDNAKLPEIRIVDLTEERAKKLELYRAIRKESFKKDKVIARLQKSKFEFGSISDILKEKIAERLEKKEGIILLQNRRGFSPFIECPDCGFVEICDNCNISLTYHATKDHLRCHYCGFTKQMPIFCAKCQSTEIQYHGFGTQRVENELGKLFPSAKLLRMDLDTTSGRGSHDRILKQFSEGEADILLGTQMVSKGLDFSRVTLVGVISADTQMLLPDFRSTERTFQLLTQVAGRAGRSNLEGEVIIQTYQANHPSLRYVLLHDFNGFYKQEMAFRQELSYPPYSRLVLIEFKGENGNEVIKHAQTFAGILRKQSSQLIILGPAAAALTKLKGFYRWHIIIKSLKEKDSSMKALHDILQRAINLYRNTPSGKTKSAKITIDVDPAGMM